MIGRLRGLWRFAATAAVLARAGADLRSRVRLVALRALRGGGDAVSPGVTTVAVGPLAGARVGLRLGTEDVYAFADAYVRFDQLPPPEAAGRELGQVLELGTNVGFGLAELAHRYPAARLVGVEADPANAALARANVGTWADRTTVVAAAVWDSDCELTLAPGGDSHGHEVRERRDTDGPDRPRIAGYSVQTLLDRHMPEGRIDYVLLSAERSERRILTSANGWLERVDAIRVETYSTGEYRAHHTVADLQALGFRAWLDPNPWGGFALGVRDS